MKGAFDKAVTLTGRMVPGEKLQPPADMGPEDCRRWNAIVGPLPAGFFSAEMIPQLRCLVKAMRYAERLQAIVDGLSEEAQGWPSNDDRWHNFHGQMKELRGWHGEILRWSRTLRLTPQSRYTPVKAHARTKRSTAPTAKPWEVWRGEGVKGNVGVGGDIGRTGERGGN